MKKLFLLDGHALVYRAHYAFINRPLINSKGLNTSAITGFTRFLMDILRNQQPSHIAVSFDLKGPTFRHEMYEPYKANREAQPEDITTAIPYIRQIIEGFNIPIVTMEGYEADDVIGTLAKQAEKEGFTVYMVTPDKDYAQLVSKNIYMYKPARSGNAVEILGVKEVLDKWDIANVDQVIDILGMQGDAVDNIPGIPGIGAKTAVKLLKEYKSLEGLLENTDKLKGKQKEKVIEFAEQGILSKKLATIELNVPIQFDAKKYEVEEINKDALGELFKELEFRTLAKTLLGETETQKVQKDLFGNVVGKDQPRKLAVKKEATNKHAIADKNIQNTPHDYKLIQTKAERAKLIKTLSKQKVICFDTETTGLDANRAELVGIAFSVKKNEGWYVPIPEDQEEAMEVVQEFKSIFENEKIKMVGQNIKYDCTVLKWYNIDVNGFFIDTMVMHYLLEPEQRHNLNYLSESYLNYEPVSIEALIGKKGKNQMSMREAAMENVKEYACEDADVTWQLMEVIQKELKAEKLDKLYNDIEAPLIHVLTDIEYNGVRLDSEFLGEYSKELGKLIKKYEKKIYKDAGIEFNIASPRQVGEVLFDKLKIPYRWRRTKTGQYSTDEEKLTELSANHDIIKTILKYRGLAKLKSTYVDALPQMVNPRTGRIHSSFNQALAATGRLSSNNPNLQNIPIKTPEGRKVREAFIPRDKDHILLAADYSQIELRLIADLSKDETMMEAFTKGQDIHRATAAKVYDVPYDEVNADQRRNAKTVNFSIIYGAGATNLSKQLDIKRSEAKTLIEDYFKGFHGLRQYMDETVEFAREHGFVTTMLGRKRKIRDIDSRNGMLRSMAERIAINTPIQGTAADMIKIAMINIHNEMKKGNFKSKMILQVHDELVFDVHKKELKKLKPIIEENMKNAIPGLKVPILVGMDTGDNWLEAH